jgi:hypothetical protein
MRAAHVDRTGSTGTHRHASNVDLRRENHDDSRVRRFLSSKIKPVRALNESCRAGRVPLHTPLVKPDPARAACRGKIATALFARSHRPTSTIFSCHSRGVYDCVMDILGKANQHISPAKGSDWLILRGRWPHLSVCRQNSIRRNGRRVNVIPEHVQYDGFRVSNLRPQQ